MTGPIPTAMALKIESLEKQLEIANELRIKAEKDLKIMAKERLKIWLRLMEVMKTKTHLGETVDVKA